MRSVVLASCQGEQFIGQQLDSILDQLSDEDEVIVSDDASTDRTVAVVSERADARVRLLENTVRVGYVRNFQRALDQARGDVVYFADQDDVWLPNKVMMLDSALERGSCVGSDAVVVDEGLREIHPSFFRWRRARNFSSWSILLRPRIIGATLACTRQYLSSLLPLPRGVPHDFWISLNAAWDGTLEVVHTPLILYRRHSSTMSTTATGISRSLAVIASERCRVIGSMLKRRLLTARARETGTTGR